MYNISNPNQYGHTSNLVRDQYFYTKNFTALLHFQKGLALYYKCFLKNPLLTTFSLHLIVSEVWNISNKYWLPDKSGKKRFLHKPPYTNPSPFQKKKKKKLGSKSHKFLKRSTFITCLLVFTVNEMCNFSNRYQPININIFTQETLYCSFIWKNCWCYPSQMFFKTSTFYHIFTISNSEWGLFVIFQIKTDFLTNQLKKYFYTRHLNWGWYLQQKEFAFFTLDHGLINTRTYMSHLKAKIKRPVSKRTQQSKRTESCIMCYLDLCVHLFFFPKDHVKSFSEQNF